MRNVCIHTNSYLINVAQYLEFGCACLLFSVHPPAVLLQKKSVSLVRFPSTGRKVEPILDFLFLSCVCRMCIYWCVLVTCPCEMLSHHAQHANTVEKPRLFVDIH